MPQPLIVGMTPEIIVEENFIIRFVAVAAADGSNVAGVNFAGGAILATELGGGPAAPPAKFTILPAYTQGGGEV